MGNILVVGEHQNGKVKKVTFELVSKAFQLANELGSEVDCVFVGHGIEKPEEVGLYGAKKSYLIDNPQLQKYNTEGFVKILSDLIPEISPSIILGTASPLGKDLFPRLAASLGTGLATDCTDLKIQAGKLVATRPIYAGKALVDLSFETGIQMATARPNSFIPELHGNSPANVIPKNGDPGPMRGVLKELIQGKSDKADLTEAPIIVSGGRAMKSAENFKLLQELAEALGATVGASRAAVDSGYATHDMQVGQTGKTVNPNLYVACGISGAIQHLAGMRTSKVIVAINKDPEAPIFTKADYGIVGDLFQLIPLLTAEFKRVLAD